jgi:hypothetical protein
MSTKIKEANKMPKVTDFKFKLDNEEYCVHVNCTSSGKFTANLPQKVATALSLNSKLEKSTLEELSKDFYHALDRFKKAETKEEVFINIRYAACGNFRLNSKGRAMFSQQEGGLYLDVSFGGISAVGFEFEMLIKETVDHVETWYEAELGKDVLTTRNDKFIPDKYYKRRSTHINEGSKTIPFSKESLATLKATQEVLRATSETLYKFITQDDKKIELMLIQGGIKLLQQ